MIPFQMIDELSQQDQVSDLRDISNITSRNGRSNNRADRNKRQSINRVNKIKQPNKSRNSTIPQFQNQTVFYNQNQCHVQMQTELENTPECMFGAGHKPYRIIGHRKVNGLVEYEVLWRPHLNREFPDTWVPAQYFFRYSPQVLIDYLLQFLYSRDLDKDDLQESDDSQILNDLYMMGIRSDLQL